MTKQEVLDILEENKELIEQYKFKEFYEKIKDYDRHYFTELFIDCGVNPLLYMKSIPSEYLYESTKIKTIEIPSNITHIESHAFQNSHLSEIKIPKNVLYIGLWAFIDSPNLEKIDMKECEETDLKECCLTGCINLKTLILPYDLKSLGSYAISECLSLEKVWIPKSLKTIGAHCFDFTNEFEIYYEGNEQEYKKSKIEKKLPFSPIVHYNIKAEEV